MGSGTGRTAEAEAGAVVGVGAVLARFWAAHAAGAAELPKVAARLDHVVRTELGAAGEPVRAAARLLVGAPARAWSARLALIGVEAPEAQRAFVEAAVREYDAGYAVPPGAVTSTLGYHREHEPARMTDGDPATYYWSAGAVVEDAAVTVDLGHVRRVRGVRLSLGKPDRPGDYLHRGVLEFSADGRNWYAVARVDGPEHEFAVQADIRFLRLRSTADQRQWLVVREMAVVGSPSGRAADGDPATVFTVTTAPVEVPLDPRSPASAIVVRAAGDTERGGAVQVRMDGGVWRTLGALAGPYTELPLPRGRATRVRIVPGDGMTPLGVHEVTARRAG